MPSLKPGTIIPREDEDAVLTEAAIADQDARPLTDAEWEATKPKARIGHPSTRAPKVSTTIRFDADVLAAMKATGPGWQTRINEIVREYVNSQQLHRQ
ncbi:MAG: BrnA antitoxin family protein [Halochromatium sp.]|uniref:BrnA antitoxin family protein n=1 Tax=Halochromatium sp. TaxID=2049430 RepID=UPI00397E864A